MAKRKKKIIPGKYNMGTIWFLTLILIAVVGATPAIVNREIIWMLVGICGAMVAIENIQKNEEISFLIGTSSIILVVISLMTIPQLAQFTVSMIGNFLINIAFGFGVSAFSVAMGLIARLGLEK